MADDLKPPVARYRLELVITGNTIDELVHELELQSNDYAYEALRGRTTRNMASGRAQLKVDETNPEMTPERYDEELMTWFDARRAART